MLKKRKDQTESVQKTRRSNNNLLLNLLLYDFYNIHCDQ